MAYRTYLTDNGFIDITAIGVVKLKILVDRRDRRVEEVYQD